MDLKKSLWSVAYKYRFIFSNATFTLQINFNIIQLHYHVKKKYYV